jgi:hypothetical protein
MILDFGNDDRADARGGIGCAERERGLHGQQFVPHAIYIAHESHAVEHRAEIEAMTVAGQL